MIPYIDADVIKYAVGFAAQKKVFIFHDAEDFPVATCKIDRDKGVTNGYRVINKLDGEVIAKSLGRSETLMAAQEILGAAYHYETLELDPLANCLHSVKQQITSIITKSGGTVDGEYHLLLTGPGNFRENIATQLQYKGNRLDTEKPVYYQEIHDYLVNTWHAEVIKGMEADDAMSIAQATERARLKEEFHANVGTDGEPTITFDEYVKEYSQVIIATIDKDLDMAWGWRFSWADKDPDEPYFIGEQAGRLSFYRQILTGDKSCDNIPGVKGIGKVKAKKILPDGEYTEKELWERVYDEYATVYGDYIDYTAWYGMEMTVPLVDYITERARLLWMMEEAPNKKLTNLWVNPYGKAKKKKHQASGDGSANHDTLPKGTKGSTKDAEVQSEGTGVPQKFA